MIPIYFDDRILGSEDLKRISQIFISDKAGKQLPWARLGENEPNLVETDRCLRVYASEISKTTFPFLSQHPQVVSGLRRLVSRQKEVPSQTTLEALVKFGSTARLRNWQWEAQDA